MMLRAGLWVFAGKLGHQAVRFLLVIVLARLLTPEAFGIVAAAQVLLALSEVVVRFGIGVALIQKTELEPRVERGALTLVLALAAVIAALLLLAAPHLAALMNVPELEAVIPVILVSFLLSAAVNPSASLLARDMRFRFLSLVDIVSYAVGYGLVAVGLALLGFSYWSLILATLVQSALRAGCIFLRRPLWPTLDLRRDEMGPLVRFGGGVFLAQLMAAAAQRADNVVVTATFGPAALGFYSRAYALMDLSNALLGSVFREVLFSGFSMKRRRETAPDRREEALLMSHAFAALVILPISALLFLLAGDVVRVVLGEAWTDAVPVLQILALGMYFRLGYKVSAAFILSEGLAFQVALRNTLFAAAVLAGSLVGARWGLQGVACGVLLALVAHFATLTALACRLCGASGMALARALLPFMSAGGLAAAAAWWLSGTIESVSLQTSILRILSVGASFGLVYIAALTAFRRHGAVRFIHRRFANVFRTKELEPQS